MNIHAKSLNQLADELEGRWHLQSQDTVTTPRSADEVRTLIKGLQAFTQEIVQRLEGSPSTATLVAPVTTSEPPPVLMDSTFGVRTRAQERAELRKVESTLRLDTGFACRGDFTGNK